MDDFFSPPSPADPTSTFLDRERAAGLDSSFGTSSNVEGDYDFESSANTFPDLDGDFDGPVPVVPQQHTFQPSSQQPKVSVTNDNEFAAFEEDYPEIDVGTQSSLPLQPSNEFNSSITPSYQQPASLFQGTPQPIEEESEFIKSWKVKQAAEIAKREEEAAMKKDETVVKARLAIDKFYQDYNGKKEKNISKNKEEESDFKQTLQDSLSQGTTWDRICELVDLQDSRSKTTSGKGGKDLGRFKEILLALKREGDSAPGAGGY